MSDELRDQIAARIGLRRQAAYDAERWFGMGSCADAVMEIVQPLVEQLRQAEVSRDAYRDERDQTQRERDLAVWLHAEAVWNWRHLADRYDRALEREHALRASAVVLPEDWLHLVERAIAEADGLGPVTVDAATGAIEALIDSWRPCHSGRHAGRSRHTMTAQLPLANLDGIPGAHRQLLDVFVPGRPAPQGSVKAVIHKTTGRAVVIKDNDKTQKAWRKLVVDALTDPAGRPIHVVPTETPVTISLAFVMPRPVSTPKRRTPAAIRKPDIDKLARNLLDGITAAEVIDDDARVIDLHATKRIAELGEAPGCRITIHTPAGQP